MKRKILVLDDDKITQQVIARMLKDGGYSVVIADDGEKCLKVFNKVRFDILITDILMPEKDGYEVIFEARKKYGDSYPIIAISSDELGGYTGALEIAKIFGATSIIQKPIDRKKLLTTI